VHYGKAICRIKGDLSMDAAGISGKEAVERMPPRFSFVEEGRVYFELISRWAMLFM
jgi:hypothetical protein